MSIVINARGTSVPFFKIGKGGITVYQGSIDPTLAYTPGNSDLWINSGTNALETWSSSQSLWVAPRLANLNFNGSTVVAGPSESLTLQTDPGQSIVLNAGASNPILTAPIGKDLQISGSMGGNLHLNANIWPISDGGSGQILTTNGLGQLTWSTVSGTGTVTSVGLVDDSITPIYSITGSPVTAAGDLSLQLLNQTANNVFIAPYGNDGQPAFRLLQYIDLPIKLYAENISTYTAPTATGNNAIAFGDSAKSAVYGMKSFANGKFSNTGDAQHGMYVLRNITTNAIATELFLNGSNQSLVIPNNSVVSFSITIAARRTDTTGGGAGYKFDGVVMKDTTSASISLIGIPSKTVLGETNKPWDVTLTTNTTNGSLKISVIGEAFKTIRWVATVLTTEVTN